MGAVPRPPTSSLSDLPPSLCSSAAFFLRICQDLSHGGLDLSCLQNRQLVMSPVAIFCLSGIPMTPDTSSSCPKHPSSLPGTWTTSPGGAVCHSADPGVARWLPGLHPAIYACCPGPGFCIALPTLVPGVDSHMPGRELPPTRPDVAGAHLLECPFAKARQPPLLLDLLPPSPERDLEQVRPA